MIRVRLFSRPFGCLPADLADFPLRLLLLLLWPCRAQKVYLAPVTDHIKAMSCFECVILALMVNGVVVHALRVCVHVCVCVVVRLF